MSFFHDFKTEIKIFLIALAVLVIFAVGAILLLKNTQLEPVIPVPTATPTPTPSPQQETEALDASNFTLNEVEGWQTYRNDEFGFEFEYPSGGSVTATSYGPRIMLPIEESGTNRSGKYLDIAVDNPVVHGGYLAKTEQVSIGGNVFTKETRGGAEAGNLYNAYAYIINHNGKEHNFSFTLHSTNIGNYDPSIRPKEFDKGKESALFEQILSTFRFVE